MNTVKTLNSLLLCTLVSGCAAPMNSYLPAHLTQDIPAVSKQSVSVNQLLAKARGEQTSMNDEVLYDAMHTQETVKNEQLSLRFNTQETTLSTVDQRKLQQYSQSSNKPLLYIECGAAGNGVIENFRIALHRCKNIQRFLNLISQQSKAQVSTVKPLQFVSISAVSAMQGIQ